MLRIEPLCKSELPWTRQPKRSCVVVLRKCAPCLRRAPELNHKTRSELVHWEETGVRRGALWRECRGFAVQLCGEEAFVRPST